MVAINMVIGNKQYFRQLAGNCQAVNITSSAYACWELQPSYITNDLLLVWNIHLGVFLKEGRTIQFIAAAVNIHPINSQSGHHFISCFRNSEMGSPLDSTPSKSNLLFVTLYSLSRQYLANQINLIQIKYAMF
jgi:hypothetical protein